MTPRRRRLIQWGSVAGVVTTWEAAVRGALLDPTFVPAPTAVARALATIGPTALGLLGETLGKTLVAYVLSVVLGVGVGLVVEMFGGIRGMGFLLASLATAFRAPELFAATAFVSSLSVAGVLGLEALSRRLARWR